jgi:phenylacetate-CoA ligase
MQILKTYNKYTKISSNQWVTRGRLLQMQAEKLRKLVRHAYLTVPYYRKLFDDSGITPQDISTPEDLKKIPVTTKAELQRQKATAITSDIFDFKTLHSEHTSGSTGRPFTVYFDKNYLAMRNAQFLRTLHIAGYRLGQKILLVTGDSPPKKSRPCLRWRYASIRQAPAELLAILNEHRPEFLYGCITPLRLLAEYLDATGAKFCKPKKILVTAEHLDIKTRSMLRETFEAEVHEFYGLTEMGPVAWECSAHCGLHISEDSTIVELIPAGSSEETAKVVMTNLDLMAMPLIRFESGDLASSFQDEPCNCGRTFLKLTKIEGRSVDCFVLKDGSKITPYQLTCALEKIENLTRYQIVQETHNQCTIRYEAHKGFSDQIDEKIKSQLAPIVGKDLLINTVRYDKIAQKPGVKFRIVESLLGKEIL